MISRQPTLVTNLPSTGSTPHLPTVDTFSTSILVRGLNILYSQVQVSAAIYKLLGPHNIVSVLYNRAQYDTLGRHNENAMIRCLNSASYTLGVAAALFLSLASRWILYHTAAVWRAWLLSTVSDSKTNGQHVSPYRKLLQPLRM